MPVDRSNLDLSRFRYSDPAWWRGFNRGAAQGREQARKEAADWRQADWQRGKMSEGETV